VIIRLWPPILWLCVSGGSLLVLIGYDGAETHPAALIAGLGLIVAGALGSLWLAFLAWRDHPSIRGVAWLVPATLAFYVICAIAASAVGSAYAVAATVAGLIPLTAVALLTATARAKTARGEDGLRDRSVESDDPFPGIGADTATPLGDTPEHSTAERVSQPRPRRRHE
jgi:hypothetical protein